MNRTRSTETLGRLRNMNPKTFSIHPTDPEFFKILSAISRIKMFSITVHVFLFLWCFHPLTFPIICFISSCHFHSKHLVDICFSFTMNSSSAPLCRERLLMRYSELIRYPVKIRHDRHVIAITHWCIGRSPRAHTCSIHRHCPIGSSVQAGEIFLATGMQLFGCFFFFFFAEASFQHIGLKYFFAGIVKLKMGITCKHFNDLAF